MKHRFQTSKSIVEVDRAALCRATSYRVRRGMSSAGSPLPGNGLKDAPGPGSKPAGWFQEGPRRVRCSAGLQTADEEASKSSLCERYQGPFASGESVDTSRSAQNFEWGKKSPHVQTVVKSFVGMWAKLWQGKTTMKMAGTRSKKEGVD